jgi:hypothetical protein
MLLSGNVAMSRPGQEPEIDVAVIEAALSRLPQWQPPAGFVARVSLAFVPARPAHWLHLLPRGLSIAAGVSVTAWLSAELLTAGLQGISESDASVAAWTLTAASLAGVWHLVRRGIPHRA